MTIRVIRNAAMEEMIEDHDGIKLFALKYPYEDITAIYRSLSAVAHVGGQESFTHFSNYIRR